MRTCPSIITLFAVRPAAVSLCVYLASINANEYFSVETSLSDSQNIFLKDAVHKRSAANTDCRANGKYSNRTNVTFWTEQPSTRCIRLYLRGFFMKVEENSPRAISREAEDDDVTENDVGPCLLG